MNSTYTSHYTGAGDPPAWTVEPVSGHWTRYVTGISGLAAIETDTSEPVLQLQDLQGNIVATASISQTATKLLSTERSTEYGVPTSSKPARYSWLGTNMNPTELPSGVVAMGARSYVPQLGRFLQTDPQRTGSANAYAYTYGDPINSSDPTSEYTWGFSESLVNQLDAQGQEIIAREAAREQAAREEAERLAAEQAAALATFAATQINSPEEGGVEEPPFILGCYAGWACKYAAETGQEDERCGGEPVAVAAAPCAHEENPHKGYCGKGLPAGKLNEYWRDRSRKGHRRYNVKLRTKSGGWRDVANTYCGIVGGAALVPGVDVFGAPVEIGCAGYGVYTAVETIVKAL